MKIREENHRRRKVGTLTIDDLYDCYYNELVLWADTILNDMDMAEDLVQDLFVALWEKGIDRQLESKGVRAYLYTAVRNKAVRALKGERKTVDLPDIADMLMVWEDVDMSRQQLLELVIGELEKLPPRSREVLECIHLKNMKYAGSHFPIRLICFMYCVSGKNPVVFRVVVKKIKKKFFFLSTVFPVYVYLE